MQLQAKNKNKTFNQNSDVFQIIRSRLSIHANLQATELKTLPA